MKIGASFEAMFLPMRTKAVQPSLHMRAVLLALGFVTLFGLLGRAVSPAKRGDAVVV
jgi:hypothetical protein